MFRVAQEDAGYILTSLILLIGGVFTLVGYGFGIPLMIGLAGGSLLTTGGLLAGMMALYEVFSARHSGIKHLKRGYTMFGLWMMLTMLISTISLPAAIFGFLMATLPFLGLGTAAFLALEELKSGKRGIVLLTAWMALSSIFALVGTFGLAYVPMMMAVLAIAAGYFLIQDK